MRRSVGFVALLALLAPACAPPIVDGELRTWVDDWRDQVIYQVLVDRFDDADPSNDTVGAIGPSPDDLSRHQGGDWRGVEGRLDYLERLGVTAIWLSPPYLNVERTEREDGYHGYWPADFTRANPRYGALADLRSLVDAAHARGMLVILDVVPNHAGRVFAYDLDADGEADTDEIEPAWRDEPFEGPLLWAARPQMWDASGATFELDGAHFHRRGAGDLSDPVQRELGDFPTGLRDLDTESPAVVAALIATHVRWVEQTDVDGFRIDAVPHASSEFWAAFCAGLRRALDEHGKERFLLLGEVFTGEVETLARYTGIGQLDAAFAFDLKLGLVDPVVLDGRAPAAHLAPLGVNRGAFPASPQPLGVELDPWSARVTFADNHDVPRLRGELDDPLAAAVALTLVLTVDGIPSVYYGTEQGFDGRVHHAARERLWDSGFDESHPTFAHIARLTALRRGSEALRRGALEVRYAADTGGADDDPGPDAGVLAYERSLGAERLLVVINAALESSTARVPTGFSEGTRLSDALGGANAPWLVGPSGVLEITLPGRASVVLR